MRRTTILVFLAFALIYSASSFTMPLMEPDEGRYLTIPWEMAQSGDFVLPTLDGVPYLEKPPLQYWATALLMKAFGPRVWTGRVVPVAATLLCALLLFLFVRRESDEARGLAAAAVFLGSLYTLGVGRLNTLDPAFGFFTAWALFSAWRHLKEGGSRHLYIGWAALLLAFFTKGFAAPVLAGGALFVYSLVKRRPLLWLEFVRPLPLAVFAAVVIGWLRLLEGKCAGAAYFFVVHEHFARYTSGVHSHEGPIWYFAAVLLAGLLPWTFRLTSFAPPERGRDAAVYLASWAGFVLVFFSLSSSKLPTYLTPMWPAACGLAALMPPERTERLKSIAAGGPFLLAVAMAAAPFYAASKYGSLVTGSTGFPLFLLGAALSAAAGFRIIRRGTGTGEAVLTGLLTALALALFTLPAGNIMGRLKGSEGIARVVEQNLWAGDVPARYKEELQGLPFLLRRRVAILGPSGELAFGMERLEPERRRDVFPTKAEYLQAVAKGGRFLIVMRRKRMDEFKREWGPAELVGSWGRFVVLRSVARQREGRKR